MLGDARPVEHHRALGAQPHGKPANFGGFIRGGGTGHLDTPRELLRTEIATVASILSAPMHSVPTALARQLRSLGAPVVVPSIEVVARASQLRVLTTHTQIEASLDAITRFADSDGAVLGWREPQWYSGSAIAVLLVARRFVQNLTPELQGAGASQRQLARDLLTTSFAADVREVFRRRLMYLFAEAFPDDLPDLLLIVTRAVFARSTFYAGVTFLRTLCNGWLTTRRLVHSAQRCMLGCCAVGGDDVGHVFWRPVILQAIASQSARPPAWAQAARDPLRTQLLADGPLPDAEVLLMWEWAYVLQMVYNGAHAAAFTWTPRDTNDAMRAQLRALWLRSEFHSTDATNPSGHCPLLKTDLYAQRHRDTDTHVQLHKHKHQHQHKQT